MKTLLYYLGLATVLSLSSIAKADELKFEPKEPTKLRLVLPDKKEGYPKMSFQHVYSLMDMRHYIGFQTFQDSDGGEYIMFNFDLDGDKKSETKVFVPIIAKGLSEEGDYFVRNAKPRYVWIDDGNGKMDEGEVYEAEENPKYKPQPSDFDGVKRIL